MVEAHEGEEVAKLGRAAAHRKPASTVLCDKAESRHRIHGGRIGLDVAEVEDDVALTVLSQLAVEPQLDPGKVGTDDRSAQDDHRCHRP